MRKQLVSAPALEPVSVDEAIAHLNLTGSVYDQVHIAALITAARVYAERITGRALISQQWRLYLDRWPAGQCIWLPLGQLLSVDGLSYVQTDGTAVAWVPSSPVGDLQDADGATVAHISTTSEVGGAIVLPVYQSWPSAQLRASDAISVLFTAGYGVAAADVPAPIRHAILMLVATWYDNREAVQTGTAITQVAAPFAVDALLAQYRIY